MIATLLAAALLATASPPPAKPASAPVGPAMMQATLSPQDLSFLEGFLAFYAGQGCTIQSQQGVQACQVAIRATEVLEELKAAAPVARGLASH